MSCNIHQHMTAKIWVFDHPFYAVTDAQGKYEIKDIPAGVEVWVVGWHEESGKNGYLLPESSPARTGQKMTFEDKKEIELNFKIKKN
jgi:hypothetical protein